MTTLTAAETELLPLFRVLADETRLKIVGLLASEPRTGAQLAATLAVKPAALAHHVDKLVEAGLISSRAEGQIRRYSLRLDGLRATAKRLLAMEAAPLPLPDDLDAYDRKVLKDFLTRDGALKEIPMQERKLLAVLRHIVEPFEPGHAYSEKQVNEMLRRFHEDTASLRRYLVDHGLMQREATGRQYWRSDYSGSLKS
jgi:hypothetical protein